MENTDEEEGEKVVNKGVVEKVVEPGGKVFNIVTLVDIVVKLTALGIEQDVETTWHGGRTPPIPDGGVLLMLAIENFNPAELVGL